MKKYISGWVCRIFVGLFAYSWISICFARKIWQAHGLSINTQFSMTLELILLPMLFIWWFMRYMKKYKHVGWAITEVNTFDLRKILLKSVVVMLCVLFYTYWIIPVLISDLQHNILSPVLLLVKTGLFFVVFLGATFNVLTDMFEENSTLTPRR